MFAMTRATEEDYFGLYVNNNEDDLTTPTGTVSLESASSRVDSSGSLITRLKQSFAGSPIGSIFHTSSKGASNVVNPPSTNSTAQYHALSNSEVKPHLFARFSNSSYRNHTRSRNSSYSTWDSRDSLTSMLPSSSEFPPVSSSSTMNDTPPQTPESLSLDFTVTRESPSISPQSLNRGIHIIDRSSEDARYGLRSKKGKEPARQICYDTLIADISNDTKIERMHALPEDTLSDDEDDWYGLGYTIELSRRESRGSMRTPTEGEHSKSRASWAAMYRRPRPEDVQRSQAYEYAYRHWQLWHAYLDYQQIHVRAYDFLIRAGKASDLYREEKYAWRWFEWCKEEFGQVMDEDNVLAHLDALARHRPDPYYPPEKRQNGWHLVRSRSLASLRQLRPPPAL